MKTGRKVLLGMIMATVIGFPAFCDGAGQNVAAGYKSFETGVVSGYKAIEDGVVSGYKSVETNVVSGYKNMENGVASGYKKIENKFADTFLASLTQSGRQETSSSREPDQN